MTPTTSSNFIFRSVRLLAIIVITSCAVGEKAKKVAQNAFCLLRRWGSTCARFQVDKSRNLGAE